MREVALRFVALFAGHVLRPYVEAGLPKEGLPEIVERMKHLRKLAVEATAALMRQSIADEIEAVARANLPRAGGERRLDRDRARGLAARVARRDVVVHERPEFLGQLLGIALQRREVLAVDVDGAVRLLAGAR